MKNHKNQNIYLFNSKPVTMEFPREKGKISSVSELQLFNCETFEALILLLKIAKSLFKLVS